MKRCYKDFTIKYELINFENDQCDLTENLKELNKKKSYSDKKLFDQMKDTFRLLKDYGFIYFRGQHNNWDIVPSLERYNNMQVKRINKFKEELRRKFPQRFPDNLEKQNMVICESQYQHFGIPTKLIDVTVNPWIAYYFMFEEDIKSKDELYIEDCIVTKTLYALKPKSENANKLIKELPVDENNPRITAQEGLFLYPYIDSRKAKKNSNVNLSPYEMLQKNFYIVKIEIKADTIPEYEYDSYKMLIKDQQSQLELIGYTQDKIYPDFHKLIENTMSEVNGMQEF